MKSKLRVAVSGLGDAIFAGRVKANGIEWHEGKQDVTSDVLRATVEYVGENQSLTVNVGGKPKYEISVKLIQ